MAVMKGKKEQKKKTWVLYEVLMVLFFHVYEIDECDVGFACLCALFQILFFHGLINLYEYVVPIIICVFDYICN